MKKPASLGASLIATKGKAAPSAEVPLNIVEQGGSKTLAVVASTEKRIAITVKLLESPYLRMKAYGAANRKTNQDILEVALNEYLDKLGA